MSKLPCATSRRQHQQLPQQQEVCAGGVLFNSQDACALLGESRQEHQPALPAIVLGIVWPLQSAAAAFAAASSHSLAPSSSTAVTGCAGLSALCGCLLRESSVFSAFFAGRSDHVA